MLHLAFARCTISTTIIPPHVKLSIAHDMSLTKRLHCVVFFICIKDPGGSMSYTVGLPNNLYKPITNTAWVRARLCKLQKRFTRLAAASDKVYQLLAHGRWFSPSTSASSTTKTGHHDIAEILLKVGLSTRKIKSNLLNLFK